ncbi:Transcription factor GTE10 [Phytophthora citrophthora]|uniref:Transcription factor GTE10 n=1 Tax=Phytophthora citrophthora TaxID=4793 RepID=A0AAD9GMH8_9STRA|nr:Transcription factor GTE10 [Phytophthora citrophthora]
MPMSSDLHADLSRHVLVWPFLEPVDPVVLNVPTYYDVISNPMDLGTMGAKLNAGDYHDPAEYRADLLLQRAKERRVMSRWKRDSFVARLNRDKMDERRRLVASHGE